MSTVIENTDQVERSIVIQAPRTRVWNALTHAESFGAWFGADLKGQAFVPGKRTRGLNTACGHDNVWFDVLVERIDPQDLFSYRWHPFNIDTSRDYGAEPETLVTFTLEDAPGGGTRLTVIESGFDALPPGRRQEAFPMHSRGWEVQLEKLARHAAA